MTLPTFLVVGAMKAGTTSLYEYLRAHPDVFMAAGKELHFFPDRFHWSRGVDWYAAQFDGAGSARAVGEASTSYSVHPLLPDVPERATALLPGVRVVYLVRDPIDRIRSHYRHTRASGYERQPPAEAVVADPWYVAASSYATQVERWLEAIAPDRLLVVTADSLRHERAAAYARILDFLGVPRWEPAGLHTESHRSSDKRRRAAPDRLLKRLPGYAAVARRAPRALVAPYRRAVSRPVDRRPVELPPATVDALRAVLVPEVERLQRLVPAGVAAEIGRWPVV